MTWIQKGYEEPIDLDEIGIRTRDLIIESPSPVHDVEKIEGMDGVINSGTTTEERYIHGKFRFVADDWKDYSEKRNQVFNLFKAKKSFYLIDKREPDKKWLVKTASRFDTPRKGMMSDFNVDFISFGGLAESIEKYTKTFTTNQFTVFNDGTETIDAREHELLITYKGKSDKLRIRNETTGEQWQHLKNTVAGDVLKLDQVYPYKNGDNIFSDTDHGALTIAPGANDMRIYGASGDYEISFEFVPLHV